MQLNKVKSDQCIADRWIFWVPSSKDCVCRPATRKKDPISTNIIAYNYGNTIWLTFTGTLS